MRGECRTHGGDEKGIQTFLVGEPGGKRTYGRPRRRWNLKETGSEGVDWIHVAHVGI